MATKFNLSTENVLNAIKERDKLQNKETAITHLPGNWDFISDENKISWLQKEVGLFFAETFLI